MEALPHLTSFIHNYQTHCTL